MLCPSFFGNPNGVGKPGAGNQAVSSGTVTAFALIRAPKWLRHFSWGALIGPEKFSILGSRFRPAIGMAPC